MSGQLSYTSQQENRSGTWAWEKLNLSFFKLVPLLIMKTWSLYWHCAFNKGSRLVVRPWTQRTRTEAWWRVAHSSTGWTYDDTFLPWCPTICFRVSVQQSLSIKEEIKNVGKKHSPADYLISCTVVQIGMLYFFVIKFNVCLIWRLPFFVVLNIQSMDLIPLFTGERVCYVWKDKSKALVYFTKVKVFRKCVTCVTVRIFIVQ